jgi:hypothetical protein
LFHEVQLVLIAVADAEVLCALTEGELEWTKRKTTWLTWDALYGTDLPSGVKEYREGKPLGGASLRELRHKNLSLQRVRHDDELAYRARAEARRQNLWILSIVLTVALSVLVLAYRHAVDVPFSWIAAVVSAGALGAALSGTIRARDRLTRQGDITRFRDGLLAQLLVGASTAVVVVLFLQGGLITIGELEFDSLQQQASGAFLAGFSEPWFLRTIERAGTLGTAPGGGTSEKESEA